MSEQCGRATRQGVRQMRHSGACIALGSGQLWLWLVVACSRSLCPLALSLGRAAHIIYKCPRHAANIKTAKRNWTNGHGQLTKALAVAVAVAVATWQLQLGSGSWQLALALAISRLQLCAEVALSANNIKVSAPLPQRDSATVQQCDATDDARLDHISTEITPCKLKRRNQLAQRPVRQQLPLPQAARQCQAARLPSWFQSRDPPFPLVLATNVYVAHVRVCRQYRIV